MNTAYIIHIKYVCNAYTVKTYTHLSRIFYTWKCTALHVILYKNICVVWQILVYTSIMSMEIMKPLLEVILLFLKHNSLTWLWIIIVVCHIWLLIQVSQVEISTFTGCNLKSWYNVKRCRKELFIKFVNPLLTYMLWIS